MDEQGKLTPHKLGLAVKLAGDLLNQINYMREALPHSMERFQDGQDDGNRYLARIKDEAAKLARQARQFVTAFDQYQADVAGIANPQGYVIGQRFGGASVLAACSELAHYLGGMFRFSIAELTVGLIAEEFMLEDFQEIDLPKVRAALEAEVVIVGRKLEEAADPPPQDVWEPLVEVCVEFGVHRETARAWVLNDKVPNEKREDGLVWVERIKFVERVKALEAKKARKQKRAVEE